jgi:2-polyprenyl-3-methyl-5-hydroxy-6-metoxy-1,4-benzoquinol methylase/spore coat polysaccharide biosynthesis predicted glycosyltransferase SpsG
MEGKGIIIVVPAFKPKRGGGHLVRCMKLTADLRSIGKQAVLFVSSQTDPDLFFQSMNFNLQWRITEDDLMQTVSGTVEFVITDRFQTPLDELLRWKNIAPVIGIDEGGVYRDNFDFLIDILSPKNFLKPSANITSVSLLKFPDPLPVEPNADKKIRILISFGHEDQTELGIFAAQALNRQNKKGNLDITLLKGVLNTSNSPMQNVRVIDIIPNLEEHLAEYDVVFTHYGITAYEALHAGTAVVLVNPTAYHEKLSKAAGFFTVKKIPKINKSFVKKLKNHCADQTFKLGLDNKKENLAGLINGFSPQVNRCCPICGENQTENSIARFTERTYRRCEKCGLIYMDRTSPPSIEYGQEYFFDNYKKQYGKTYLEDFPNLTKIAKRRLKKIKSLMPVTKDKTILDIGCAYGAFLAAAKEEGFSPCGIDPAREAVRHVQKKLRITVVHGFFPYSWLPVPNSPDSSQYDIVTMWYVVEHFADSQKAFTEILKILKPGGILALSTPSFSGVSGRSSLHNYLEKNPADHFTIWSPKMCKKALSLAGFKVKKIVVSGHHPERFKFWGKLAGSKISPFYWVILLRSKIFRLGDTFEVYAVKK